MNRESKEAVSVARGEFLTLQHSRGTHEHSMVLEGRWLWRSLQHVPLQQKWHMTGSGRMGSSRGHVTMR